MSSSRTFAYGECSVCRRTISLTKAGLVRSHKHPVERLMNCSGAGNPARGGAA
jgi:hypothetical protein